MELGIHAEKCECTTHCAKGVDPMGDCVCRLPGETVTAHCDVCDPTHQRMTWHNNGSCISCVRKAREEAKERNAQRHAAVMASKPHEQIEDADYTIPVRTANETPVPRVDMSVVLRVNGIDVPLATNLMDVIELIKHAKHIA